MKNQYKKNSIVGAMLFFVLITLHSEQLYSPKWGYLLDIPEGFVLTSEQDDSRFQFEHTLIPVYMLVASYPLERYKTAMESLENVYSVLQLKGEKVSVNWNDSESVIGTFTLVSGGQNYTGWAISVANPSNNGTTVMLAYSPSEQFPQYEQIIISALDSLQIVTSKGYTAGVFTSYAFPNEGNLAISAEIGGKTINSVIDKSDVDAATFVMEREYAILTFFANTELWKEAWQRFYRMIYTDSWPRLERLAKAIYESLYQDLQQKNPNGVDIDLTQALLTWVQGFDYERIPLGTDFTPLPAILKGHGSDCDSRALLLAVLMSHMDYKTMLFVSRDYSHAFFGIAIEGQGARLNESGVSYLLGETTAPVSIGMVPQDMSEITKWIGISGL